jgi:hypothetical protein
LRFESRKRAGWIHEKIPFSTTGHYNGTASLLFHPVDPKRTLGSDGKSAHLIQIQYLRTYKNAGQVKVFICGNVVFGDKSIQGTGNLDALWQSYEHYYFSLPEVEYVVFPDFGFHCNDPTDLSIRFEYVDDIPCPKHKSREICDREEKARTISQKFKLISVKVCNLAH